MTVSEKTVFRLAAEYSRRLGVSCPEIVVQNSRVAVHDYGMSGTRVGEHGGSYIMVDRRRGFYEVAHTVAHEFVHRAFPGLHHGTRFEERIEALQRGDMFFRGSIRRHASPHTIGNSAGVWVKSWTKSVMLDSKVPKRPVEKSEKVEQLEARIRKFDTKIKRLTTLRKKLERKLKRVSQ